MHPDISTDYCSPDHPREVHTHAQKHNDKLHDHTDVPIGMQAAQPIQTNTILDKDPQLQCAFLLKPQVPPHAFNGIARPRLPIPVDNSFA